MVEDRQPTQRKKKNLAFSKTLDNMQYESNEAPISFSIASTQPANSRESDHFSCAICLGIFVFPVECQPCGHIFCAHCIYHHRSVNRGSCSSNCSCPQCRGSLQGFNKVSRLLWQMLSEHPVSCRACGYRGTQEGFKAHSCEAAPLFDIDIARARDMQNQLLSVGNSSSSCRPMVGGGNDHHRRSVPAAAPGARAGGPRASTAVQLPSHAPSPYGSSPQMQHQPHHQHHSQHGRFDAYSTEQLALNYGIQVPLGGGVNLGPGVRISSGGFELEGPGAHVQMREQLLYFMEQLEAGATMQELGLYAQEQEPTNEDKAREVHEYLHTKKGVELNQLYYVLQDIQTIAVRNAEVRQLIEWDSAVLMDTLKHVRFESCRHLTVIPRSFLGVCYSLLRSVVLHDLDAVRTIKDDFIRDAKACTYVQLTCLKSLQEIGSNFCGWTSLRASKADPKKGEKAGLVISDVPQLQKVGEQFLVESRVEELTLTQDVFCSLRTISQFFAMRCPNLTSVVLDGLASLNCIGKYFCYDCPQLAHVSLRNLPALTNINEGFLDGAISLETLEFHHLPSLALVLKRHYSFVHVPDDHEFVRKVASPPSKKNPKGLPQRTPFQRFHHFEILGCPKVRIYPEFLEENPMGYQHKIIGDYEVVGNLDATKPAKWSFLDPVPNTPYEVPAEVSDFNFAVWLNTVGHSFSSLSPWPHGASEIAHRQRLVLHVTAIYKNYEYLSNRTYDWAYEKAYNKVFQYCIQCDRQNRSCTAQIGDFFKKLENQKGQRPLSLPSVFDLASCATIHAVNGEKQVKPETLPREIDAMLESEYTQIQAKAARVPEKNSLHGWQLKYMNRHMQLIVSWGPLGGGATQEGEEENYNLEWTEKGNDNFTQPKKRAQRMIPANMSTVGNTLVDMLFFDISCASCDEIGHDFLSGGAEALKVLDFTNLVNIKKIGYNFMQPSSHFNQELVIYLSRTKQPLLYSAIPERLRNCIKEPTIPLYDQRKRPESKNSGDCIIC